MLRTSDLAALAGALARGGVALLPTDTLPGLHARADRPEAVARIAALKGRAEGKPLLLLCASAAQALELAGPLPAAAAGWARRCWPGPFTLVLPRGPAAAGLADGGSDTVACRVPDVAPLRALVAAAGGPLVSTSANRAGEAPAVGLPEAETLFGAGVDAVAAGPWPGAAAGAVASALVDVTTWPPRLLREGPRPLPALPGRRPSA